MTIGGSEVVAAPSTESNRIWYIYRSNGQEVKVVLGAGTSILCASHRLYPLETMHILHAVKQIDI